MPLPKPSFELQVQMNFYGDGQHAVHIMRNYPLEIICTLPLTQQETDKLVAEGVNHGS